jgi:hypothetical protein
LKVAWALSCVPILANATTPVPDEIHSPLFAITAGGEVYRDGRRLSDQPNWREEIKLRIGTTFYGHGVVCIEARTRLSYQTRDSLMRDGTLSDGVFTVESPGCVQDHVSTRSRSRR